MDKYLVFAIISVLALGSISSVGGLINSPVLAQENMTMGMDNSTDMTNNTTMTIN